MIELDGSYGEGGGALVRVALALSTLTGKPFKVVNIRAGRQEPGLKAQHLTAITALKEMCDAKTSDVELGSEEFWYVPGKIKKGNFSFDIGTAGSITLFLQAILLPALFAQGKVTLMVQGGTCGKWQASVDYLHNILLPHLQRFAILEINVLKRGYYPQGGGKIKLTIIPRYPVDDFSQGWTELKDVSRIELTEQGELEQIRGLINLSHDLAEREIGERVKKAAETSFKRYNVPVNIRIETAEAACSGGELLVWALFSRQGIINLHNPCILGGSALLEKRKTAEQVGQEAAEALKQEIDSGAAVDHYLTDQLIPFCAILPESVIKVRHCSDHAKTNMMVAEKFLPITFSQEGNVIQANSKDL